MQPLERVHVRRDKQGARVVLGRISDGPDRLAVAHPDAEILDALYLSTLARLPAEPEQQRLLKHLKDAKNHDEVVRDILWALVNTREFGKLHGLDKDVNAELTLLNKFGKVLEKEKK